MPRSKCCIKRKIVLVDGGGERTSSVRRKEEQIVPLDLTKAVSLTRIILSFMLLDFETIPFQTRCGLNIIVTHQTAAFSVQMESRASFYLPTCFVTFRSLRHPLQILWPFFRRPIRSPASSGADQIVVVMLCKAYIK